LSNVIIFDLDGVITSEEAYWDTVGLTLHELLYSPRYWNSAHSTGAYRPVTTAQESRRLSREIFPEAAIMSLKARMINSNWDVCYVGFCLYLIELLSRIPDLSALLPLRPWEDDWISAFRQQLMGIDTSDVGTAALQVAGEPIFQGYIGFELINRFDYYASQKLQHPIEGVFARRSLTWRFCRDLFQEWYLGEPLFTQQYGHAPAQPGKLGCINFEQPLLPIEKMRSMLESLREAGYVLGVATGRPGDEAVVPLKNYGLLQYFEERHIVTDVEVMRVEAALRERGISAILGKPQPFPFLLAAYPNYQHDDPLPTRGSFIVVGDTPSDVRGAHAAGAIAVAVLTGARTNEARNLLEESRPDFIIEDVTALPALVERLDDLATIQRLQFNERAKAELLLQRWFARHMNLDVDSVTLTPRPVSLNSFNGVYRTGNEEYFFKTHVEEQGIIQEYYHAELLHNAGYNIVRPLRTLHEQGQQMVIYPVVHWPVMFDLARAIEVGRSEQASVELLAAAEMRECERMLNSYRTTLAQSTAAEHAQAPIHQLFWHRLAGERLKSFYVGKSLLAQHQGESSVSFEKVSAYQWIINGQQQRYTLGSLIERAAMALHPERPAKTIIGHGDAHFGNVFLEKERDYLYFDPAFAGRHSPLLDVVKPLFHNVFASWMYFPYECEKDCTLEVRVDEQRQAIVAQYDFTLPPVREAILRTKMQYLVHPLLAWLRAENALSSDWLDVTQSALMCCPLLTVNLFDGARMPTTISWLGLLYAVYMGNNGLTAWEVESDL
jgi:phosphoglycolate phosphatase-like HAD superfamily hydrolase